MTGLYQLPRGEWTLVSTEGEDDQELSAEEREPNVQQYALLVSGLRSMAAGEHEPTLILDSYLLRSLAVAGWSPSFDECARCAQPGPHRAFNVQAGGMVCGTCVNYTIYVTLGVTRMIHGYVTPRV